MAQTTTHINGCNAVVEVDDADGDPINISGSSNQANLEFTKQIGKGVTFEGDWNLVLECKKDAALSLRALYTKNASEARAMIEEWYENGGNRVVSVYPWGKINGARYYTGNWKLEKFDFPVDATDAAPSVLNASLVPDGAVSFSTFVS